MKKFLVFSSILFFFVIVCKFNNKSAYAFLSPPGPKPTATPGGTCPSPCWSLSSDCGNRDGNHQEIKNGVLCCCPGCWDPANCPVGLDCIRGICSTPLPTPTAAPSPRPTLGISCSFHEGLFPPTGCGGDCEKPENTCTYFEKDDEALCLCCPYGWDCPNRPTPDPAKCGNGKLDPTEGCDIVGGLIVTKCPPDRMCQISTCDCIPKELPCATPTGGGTGCGSPGAECRMRDGSRGSCQEYDGVCGCVGTV